MKTNRLATLLGMTAFTLYTLLSPIKSLNAEETKDKTPKWEITGGYVNRHIGKVKFNAPTDLQNFEELMSELSQEYPPGTIGGVVSR